MSSPTSAHDHAALMKKGINIGILFENADGKYFPFEKMKSCLTLWYSAGFRHIRIPVTWIGNSIDNPCKLNDPVFMQKLDQTISMAIQTGFYVIVNTHHEYWLKNYYDGDSVYTDKFWSLWVAIAKRYCGHGVKMIFQVLNEPGKALGDYSGDPYPSVSDPDAVNLTRSINRVGYYAIRSVTKTNIIMMSPNGLASFYTAPIIWPTIDILPGRGTDRLLMISVHTYTHWSFCCPGGLDSFYGTGTDGINRMRADFKSRLDNLMKWKHTFPLTSLALHVGEFGCSRTVNTPIVLDYYKSIPKMLFDAGISAVAVWNDRGDFNISTFDKNGYIYITQKGEQFLNV